MIYFTGVIPGLISGIAYVYWGAKLTKPNEDYRWSIWVVWFYRVIGLIIMPFLFGPLMAYTYDFFFRRDGGYGLLRFVISITLCGILGFLGSLLLFSNKKFWKNDLKLVLTIIFSFGWLLPLLYYLIVS